MKLSILIVIFCFVVISCHVHVKDKTLQQMEIGMYLDSFSMEKSNIPNLSFSMINEKSTICQTFVLFSENNKFIFKKIDFNTKNISYRFITAERYQKLLNLYNWMYIDTAYYEYSGDSEGPVNYNFGYNISLYNNNKSYKALIYDESNSKEHSKEHDASINYFKSIILEAELIPLLYDKVVDFEKEFPDYLLK